MKTKNKARWVSLNEKELENFVIYCHLTFRDYSELIDDFLHSLHPNHYVFPEHKFFSHKRKGIIYPIKKIVK